MFDGFVHKQGLKIAKVPYRDIVPAGTDLAQGRLQFMMASLAILQPHLQANTVRLVAVNGRERTDLAKGIPTAIEDGFPELELEGLVGLIGPKGMPLDLRNRLAKDVIAAAGDPEIARRLVGSAQVVNPGDPAAFAAAMQRQNSQIDAIAKAIGTPRKLKP